MACSNGVAMTSSCCSSPFSPEELSPASTEKGPAKLQYVSFMSEAVEDEG